jgi:HK97 family phage portal protein
MLNRFRLAVQNGIRGWKAGMGALDIGSMIWGADTKYSPGEFGDYLVNSNPVYTCATIRADALASLKYKAYNIDENDKDVLIKDWEGLTLLRKVNDFWTMNRLLHMTELCMFIWGKSFWAVERGADGRGKPQEIWWMKPDRVKVLVDPIKYIRGFEYTPINGGPPIFFEPWEVIWFRYPNPLNEFDALSPIMAARLAADVGTSAWKSNKHMFDNGYQIGGIVMPKGGVVLTKEQAENLEEDIDRRHRGVDKAHRWGVLRFEVEVKGSDVTPKDAQWLEALNLTLEEVARAGKIPLDMIGGQRTYENVKASDRAFWMRAMIPEGDFIGSELTEQFIPMFGPNGPDKIGADYSKVPALQDDAKDLWEREKGQLGMSAIVVNEWRKIHGMDEVEWGNEPLTAEYLLSKGITATPAGGGGGTQSATMPGDGNGEQGRSAKTSAIAPTKRTIEYGSVEHERLWKRFTRRTDRWEKIWSKMTVKLFERQRESILSKLKEEGRSTLKEIRSKDDRIERSRVLSPQQRDLEDLVDEPFNMAEWIKRFRTEGRTVLHDIVEEAGGDAMDDLSIGIAFDLTDPRVLKFLERRAQRFAKEVNQTTWDRLKEVLGKAIEEGKGIPEMEDLVNEVMGERIRSTPETIARTEVIGANNGGTLMAWEESGVVESKTWLAALDDRTRETHIEAHQRYQADPIPIDEDFQVGAATGPAPGQMGDPDEDINCRCTMTAVVTVNP